MLLPILILIFAAFYVLNALFYLRGVRRLERAARRAPALATDPPSTSVIVSARNESATIQRCLEALVAQNYPADKFEIVVIDDDSSDDTGALIDRFAAGHPQVTALHQRREPGLSAPKKSAVALGLSRAGGELILTTDADCCPGPDWLATLAGQFGADTGLVAGLPVFATDCCWHAPLQALSNLTLSVAAFALLEQGLPISCNAANMAFRKSVFDAVNGFAGVDRLESGDDDFLLQKIAFGSPWKVRATLDPRCFVHTAPQASLRAALNQYSRWGSKGLHYQFNRVTLYLTTLFLSLWSFYLGLFLLPGILAAAIWVAKIIVDLLFAARLVAVTGDRRLWRGFVPVCAGQPLFVIIAVLRGSLRWFRWK